MAIGATYQAQPSDTSAFARTNIIMCGKHYVLASHRHDSLCSPKISKQHAGFGAGAVAPPSPVLTGIAIQGIGNEKNVENDWAGHGVGAE